MKIVTEKEFLSFLRDNSIPENPEIEHLDNGYSVEDYWDKNRCEVVAWVNYFDTGRTQYCIAPERLV